MSSDVHLMVGRCTREQIMDRLSIHKQVFVYLPKDASAAGFPIVPVFRTDQELNHVMQSMADKPPKKISTERMQGGKISKEKYVNIHSMFVFIANMLATNKKTLDTFGRIWMMHMLENLPELVSAPASTDMPDQANVPLVIVSAGPSLDKNIDQLKDFEGKALLFAVQHAAPSLQRAGVNVDAFMCTDPSDICFDHLNSYSMRIAALFLGSVVDPRIWKIDSPAKYMIGGNSCDEILEQVFGEKFRMPTCDSVSTLILTLGVMKKFNPIIFVGQDLAESNKWAEHSGPSLPNEDIGEEKVISWDGKNTIQTSKQFAMIIQWLQVSAAAWKMENPELRLWNSTEGGALLPGFESIPLSESLNRIQSGNYAAPLSVFDKRMSEEQFAHRVSQATAYVEWMIPKSKKDDEEFKALLGKALIRLQGMKPSEIVAP